MVGPKHHRGTAMDYYAGIDVSLEQSSVCVVDATGKIVCEAKVALCQEDAKASCCARDGGRPSGAVL